jgi:predicted transcriptional regulator of viral defense system
LKDSYTIFKKSDVKRQSIKFGPSISRLLAWVQMRGIERATNDEIRAALRLTADQVRQLMTRVNRKGLAILLQRGLWLLPPKLPPGGRWSVPPDVILRHLFEAKGGDYQETGLGALQYQGLTDQVANVTTVYNTLFTGRRTIGGLPFQFIEVAPERLGALDKKALPQRRVGSLPRVIMDAVYDAARFGTLPAAYRWICERKDEPRFLDQLAACAVAHGDAGTCRRIGAVMELLDAGAAARRKLQRAVAPVRTFIPLVPGRGTKGSTLRQWGVIVNDRRWLDE